jgi:probable F420-dependent oxidoreductase
MSPRDAFGRIGLWTFQFDAMPWAQGRDLAAEVDSLGYGAVWIPEAVGKDPFASAALLLGATTRLGVGTGIASIYARDPLTMKAGWYAIDEAYPGRFVLGLGVSHPVFVEDVRSHRYGPPVETMREYLGALDSAMYAATPPRGTPTRVLAALGPKMLALAAEHADGAHPYNGTPEHTARAREILGPDAFLAPEQKVVLSTDPDAARASARDALAIYRTLPNYTNNWRRLGFGEDDVTHLTDRLVDSVVAWGDDDAVARRVADHLDAGADHVAVQVLTEAGASPAEGWRRLAPVLLGAT